ncbi:ABC transporter permease subunit [bacterium]|nr:ABC transporter permease subunit [bacterium]
MARDRTPSPADQSQWALIWRQFRKRRLAVVCAAIILSLVTISVFAPFLANDRPLVYRGTNRFEYREAVRTLREVLSRLADKTDKAPDAKTRNTLLTSVRLQGSLMRKALTPADAEALGTLINEAETAGAAGNAERLLELRNSIQKEFGRRDIPLQSRTFWPVLASLTWADLLFMVFNVVLLAFPLWQRPVHRWTEHHAALRKWVFLGVWIGLPCLSGWLWQMAVPARNDRTNYKNGVLASEASANSSLVIYESVTWPPIPYGLDEDDISYKEGKPALFASPDKKSNKTSPWNGPHWLGTDSIGRDVACRMIWGGRVSLSVGIVAVSIYVTIGIVIGAIAGYFRGWTDLIISRIIEIVICFPAFFLILTIVAFVGPSIFNIMVIIGLTGWTGIARLIRGEFLRLVNQEFVLAGRALGYSPTRLIFKHVLPNAMAPVLVSATFGVAGAILTESSLSFLGLGISAPTPSWGGMLSSGRDAIFRAPWLIWYPGLAIFITISCYNLVGEALRDASDPRLRGSR